MDINELESYNLADAVKFNPTLNKRLWDDREHLRPEVREKLLAIADDFRESLGVKDIDLEDITISGSNAAFNYTPNSDIDLHLVVDIPEDEVYKELFDAKKFEYNNQHNIRIGGFPVELYVQDSKEPHVSQGIYSILNDKWLSVPKRKKADINDSSVRHKYDLIQNQIEDAVSSGDYDKMAKMMKRVKNLRKAGLDKSGEFSPENLAFKMLRTQGVIQKLIDARNEAKDRELSLAEQNKKKKKYTYGFKEDVGGGLPSKSFKKLFHVGSLDATKKREGSHEGSGLSVSTHPNEWKRIARGFVTGDTYVATKPNNSFINAHKLSDENRNLIASWGVKNGLLTPTQTVIVSYYDDEMDSMVSQEFPSMEDAVEEYGDHLDDYEVTTNDKGYQPTNKLKQITRNPRITPTGILDYVLPVYAENMGYDGVWWQDTLDVSSYSAPRGVIVPSKIPSWSFTKLDEINEDVGGGLPNENSDDQPIAQTPEALANFWRWFQGSKVVDDEGRPQVRYHGTSHDFQSFDRGLIFTSSGPTLASMYSWGGYGPRYGDAMKNSELEKIGPKDSYAPKVLPLYVRATNIWHPFFKATELVDRMIQTGKLDPDERDEMIDIIYEGNWESIEKKAIIDTIRELGYDGLNVFEDGEETLAVFHPSQVKSAIGNRGSFKKFNTKITHEGNAHQKLVKEAIQSLRLKQKSKDFPIFNESTNAKAFNKFYKDAALSHIWESNNFLNKYGTSHGKILGYTDVNDFAVKLARYLKESNLGQKEDKTVSYILSLLSDYMSPSIGDTYDIISMDIDPVYKKILVKTNPNKKINDIQNGMYQTTDGDLGTIGNMKISSNSNHTFFAPVGFGDKLKSLLSLKRKDNTIGDYQVNFDSDSAIDRLGSELRKHLKEDVDLTPDGVNPTTCMFLNEEDRDPKDIATDFIKYCVDKLGIETMPRVRFKKDPQWSVRNKTFGRYSDQDHTLVVSLANRHIMDILRTIAHELTHKRQHETQHMPMDAGDTGSKWENEANAKAGILMRNYAKQHPEYFDDKPIVESRLNEYKDTPEFKKWFKGSKAREKGKPQTWYHATHKGDEKDPLGFDKFKTDSFTSLGSHFGTSSQANAITRHKMRGKDKNPRVYPVHLAVKNPLRLKDEGEWYPMFVLRQLLGKGLIDRSEFDSLMASDDIHNHKGAKLVKKLIRRLGYDSIVYLNRYEIDAPWIPSGDRYDLSDKEFKKKYKAHDSYIILDQGQAKSPFNKGTFDPKKGIVDETDILGEATGYIPTAAQANDPRFLMALTQDVRPGTLGKVANALSLNTDSQGHPQIANPNGKVERQLAEAWKRFKLNESTDTEIDEVNMSPGTLRKWSAGGGVTGMMIGVEFEMCVPNVETDDNGDLEPDYSEDSSINSFVEFKRWLDASGYYSMGEVDSLIAPAFEKYLEWVDSQFEDYREENDDDFHSYLRDAINDRYDFDKAITKAKEKLGPNASNDDVYTLAQEIRNTDIDELIANPELDEPEWSRAYDEAIDNFHEKFESTDEASVAAWLKDEMGNNRAIDMCSLMHIGFPYQKRSSGNGEQTIEEVGYNFEKFIGMPVETSTERGEIERKPGVWVIEPDPSIKPNSPDDAGLEFVHPAQPVPEALDSIQEMLSWARYNGCYTNKTTGLHINVSVPDYSRENLDYVKLALFLGDKHVLQQFERDMNNFTYSAVKNIKANIGQLSKEEIIGTVDQMRAGLQTAAAKAIHSSYAQKYTSIHPKNGWVEFRGPGGDYLNKTPEELTDTALRFAKALSIACNPEAYKQEYAKKLYKELSPEGATDSTIDYFVQYAAGLINLNSLLYRVEVAQNTRQNARAAQKRKKEELDKIYAELDSWPLRTGGESSPDNIQIEESNGRFKVSDFKQNIYESFNEFSRAYSSGNMTRGKTRYLPHRYNGLFVSESILTELPDSFLKRRKQASNFSENFKNLDKRNQVTIEVGNDIALLSTTAYPSEDVSKVELSGFVNPKTIAKVNLDIDDKIDSIVFDDGSTFPEAAEFTTVGGINITNTIFFPNHETASKACTSTWMLLSSLEGKGWKVENYLSEGNDNLVESLQKQLRAFKEEPEIIDESTVAQLAPNYKLWISPVKIKQPNYSGYIDVTVSAPDMRRARTLIKAMYNVQEWQIGATKEFKPR